MQRITRTEFDPKAVAHELMEGAGAVLLRGVFEAERIAKIRQKLERETDTSADTGSHFNQGGQDPLLQRRIWFTRLVEIDPDIARLVEDRLIYQTMQQFLGEEFIMGSLCASRIMPGFGGQQPHIDYPYWDFYRRATFPMGMNASFPLNAQAIILIDPFTEENGATALVPGSQKTLHYPRAESGFFDNCIRLTGAPGDVVLFYGAAWHCAMPNNSTAGRIGLLVEFLPKFITPIEDMLTGLDPAFRDTASPVMRQLLGFEYPWPSAPPHPPMQ
ncbi:MAG: phytanoyl-CoA dioxygenase family protein [Rhodobacteraceae bacterium]|nr:phytanoyl-CoA dioxygenase family protein [Paracoccaceae bacterium]